jgi:hypothetical protein
LKIIQIDLDEKEEQERMRDTIRQVEKSTSGDENILAATIQWLKYMDPKYSAAEADEIGVASKLIDWAVGTSICRDELDSNIEKLKALKSENLATLKTLRSGRSPPTLNTNFRKGREESRVT